MQIKRFEAKTMTAALKMVKDEFGVNAVILSARSLDRARSLFGVGRTAGVEVTAASDSGGGSAVGSIPAVADRPPLSAAPNVTERAGRRGFLHSLNAGLRSFRQRPDATGSARPSPGPAPELSRLYHHLVAQEVGRELAADLVEQLQRLPGFVPGAEAAGLQSPAFRVLQDMGVGRAAEPVERGAPRVLVMVGPGGAGKTTTAVKLAADPTDRAAGRKVALLSLDDHRIGAVEQVRIYGAILNVPVAVATSAEMVRQALKAFQGVDWLIVDTPGISSAEAQRRSELQQVLEPFKTKEVHLVLNACTRENDLARTVEDWKGFPVHRLAFTRLDEAGACGHLLNLLVRTGLPVSYLGTGPRIPEDLTTMSLATLLERIWPPRESGSAKPGRASTALRSEAPQTDRAYLVANGNSELYHRSGCKWVRKIKPEHLIRFTSAEDAEARRFIPCRNCHPQRLGRPDVHVDAWDGQQAAYGR
jgi:flagellar biosynthesis protein FlhF